MADRYPDTRTEWTPERLAALPRRDGYRLRGLDNTRLETFVDAAFAFAVSMLVISVGRIPKDYAGLVEALKGAPAFAVGFGMVMLFWSGHRQWSRRFGLEDGAVTAMSLAFVFVMLVFVYPLRLMSSAFLAYASGGRLPSEFAVGSAAELSGLFVLYGLGVAVQAGLVALLYRHAALRANALGLDALERTRTGHARWYWGILTAVGLLSAAWAGFAPGTLGIWAGFAYLLLPLALPVWGVWAQRREAALREAG